MQKENRVDMVGQKFGRLLVISFAKTKHKRAFWNCLCDCGNTCVAMGKFMRQHKKQSCGCLRRESSQLKAAVMSRENILPPGEAAFNILYASYRCSAAKRSLVFLLTKDDFRKLTKQNCFYCGKEPSQIAHPNISDGYIYNGIDRRKNEIGYAIENTVSCCKICNWMKNIFDENVFLNHCGAIVEYQNNKSKGQS